MAGAMLMIHGVGCGGGVWDRMAAGFRAAGWRCETPTLFPDKRVAADPPADLPALRFQDYVEAMAEAANALEAETGEKPVVIGHSMGGLIAQKLAERSDVSKAVFLTPAQTKECAKVDRRVMWTFFNIVVSGLFGGRKKAQKVWKRGFKYGVLNAVPRERHDQIYAGALYDSGMVYADIADGIEVDERQVDVPTLTIGAGKDRATLVEAVRNVGKKYAQAKTPGRYCEYSDNAHWILDEPGTERVVEDILHWLERLDASAASGAA